MNTDQCEGFPHIGFRLIFAACAGFSKACVMLIENGANVYTIDQNGIPVLHHAIDSKNFETIAVIVRQLTEEKEIEINRAVGIHKWTPLYRAGENKLLVFKFSHDLHLVIHDCSKEIIEFLLRHGANVHCEDKTTGTTTIQMAVIRGNLNTTQLLVAHGADTAALSKV